MDPSEKMFFILTEKPKYILPRLGCICYIRKYKYESEISKSASLKKLRVIPLPNAMLDYDIDMNCMKSLSPEEADLLLAVPEEDRLRCFRDRKAVQAALTLDVGSLVVVDEDGENLRGIVRYIGPLTEPSRSCPITGTFFGIELQGTDKGKGNTNGSYKNRQRFTCDKDCGVFAPFSRIRPAVSRSLSRTMSDPRSQPDAGALSPGDRVVFFIDNKCRQGMVVNLEEQNGKQYVRISTDTDEAGKRGGEVKVSIESVSKGEIPSGPESMMVDPPPVEEPADPHMDLNSMVEVTLGKGNCYGIIRWMGFLPEREDKMVGLELEEDKGVSDGTFKGQRLFECPPRRALFVKLGSCRPDSRFQTVSDDHVENMSDPDMLEEEAGYSTGNLEFVPPISSEQVQRVLIGRMKGIQGHCNSCYMDAALFGLFSCSSVLDSMLFKSTTPQDAPIQRTLLRDIVNPLRSKGFVEGRHVMRFRQQLQKHGYSHSFTTDEKDPEEFLIIVMHHILALDPLLKLSAAGKVQESYCYQIFLDQNHSLVLPTVQQLLEHSFHSAGLKLAEVPSCLILQMPRFGKKFKMFDKIIPSLELDITDLLSEGPQQCILCGNLAVEECTDCFKEFVFSSTGFKVFCRTCSAQVCVFI
ncbi:ubiquitin carboxyl-terminal hydrolase CYLD isoform X2 [Austrofundulus limnaeus]|uniref:Ubiquitin carboxyl-terminal hydrolase CYLD n=1 Tax=Austrofundulus limnaeus TaxID=52670 RepID=A0A2I4D767_AUSLI|nr:PREDICTED: ubiquitin carboxyl-terminal hydrolase CYLD-like isoform X2 [Austrofundulus limnaeus]